MTKDTDTEMENDMDSHVETERQAPALERNILHGLASEWECASWGLAESYRVCLKKPLFRLENMKSRLGYWSETKGEIVLARSLVFDHPWDSVREVLYHEMAHQLADQALEKNGGEPPHGPMFREACRLLHANPRASGSYETLHERLARETLNEEDRILVRIRKLMALAGSHHRHEAEAAMVKAHELMRKHHVTLLAQKTRRNFMSVFVGTPALRHFREAYALAHLLQDFYYVQGLWIQAYVMGKKKMGRVLEISGTVRNVRVAGYVHDYVNRFIDREWEAYRKTAARTLDRYRKTDFALGVIRGFSSKLSAQKETEKAAEASRAVVEIKDRQLETYMRRRYPSVRMIRPKAVRQDISVHQDGIRKGKSLVIAEAVSEQQGNRGKYLP